MSARAPVWQPPATDKVAQPPPGGDSTSVPSVAPAPSGGGTDPYSMAESEEQTEPTGLPPSGPAPPPDTRWSAEGPSSDWRSWAAAGIRLGTKTVQDLEQGAIDAEASSPTPMSLVSFGLTDKLRSYVEKHIPGDKYFEPEFLQHVRDEYTRKPETMSGKIDESLATFLGPLLIPGGGGPEMELPKAFGKVSRVAEGADEKLYGLIRQMGGKVAPQEQPSYTLAARAGRLLQKAAGSLDTFRGISHDNVGWGDGLVRSQFKLPEGQELSPEVFDSIADGAGNAYEDARSIEHFAYDEGDKLAVSIFAKDFLDLAARHPGAWDASVVARVHELRSLLTSPEWTGSDAVEVIKTLRANAREAMRTGTLKPQSWLLGSFERNAANLLEEMVGKAGDAMGIPALSQRLKDARQTIAQAMDTKAALLTSGHISSHMLARMQRAALSRSGRAAGLAPLSGNLRLLADSASMFPRSFQDASQAGKMELTNVGKLLTTIGAYGFYTHNKALMALTAAEIGARSIVTTKLLQTSVNDPQIVPMVMGAAGRFLASRPVGTSLTVTQAMSQDEKQSIIDLALIFGPLGAALSGAAPLAMNERARGAAELYEQGENEGDD